eukprot:g11809.t1
MAEAEANHGRLFSRDHAPRANIFRSTAKQVRTLEDMEKEMQRNRNTPDHAIAARADLMGPSFGAANGAVDSKVADVSMIRNLEVAAISGPTTDSGRLQPFSWKKTAGGAWDKVELHEGLPDKWNFGWVRMKP